MGDTLRQVRVRRGRFSRVPVRGRDSYIAKGTEARVPDARLVPWRAFGWRSPRLRIGMFGIKTRCVDMIEGSGNVPEAFGSHSSPEHSRKPRTLENPGRL
ncbi:hypothetical protein MRB53_023277 [Persea americana]|uniref:Uncharacterized protein n=1 Tax=Persea americana TaxID=3435 RepID=A0ACC2LA82_PERAE|nr:hypothetical protein MRB53_023277 [Persea americana]